MKDGEKWVVIEQPCGCMTEIRTGVGKGSGIIMVSRGMTQQSSPLVPERRFGVPALSGA